MCGDQALEVIANAAYIPHIRPSFPETAYQTNNKVFEWLLKSQSYFTALRHMSNSAAFPEG